MPWRGFYKGKKFNADMGCSLWNPKSSSKGAHLLLVQDAVKVGFLIDCKVMAILLWSGGENWSACHSGGIDLSFLVVSLLGSVAVYWCCELPVLFIGTMLTQGAARIECHYVSMVMNAINISTICVSSTNLLNRFSNFRWSCDFTGLTSLCCYSIGQNVRFRASSYKSF